MLSTFTCATILRSRECMTTDPQVVPLILTLWFPPSARERLRQMFDPVFGSLAIFGLSLVAMALPDRKTKNGSQKQPEPNLCACLKALE